MPKLAQHFTVYALDMPGSGFSDCSPNMKSDLHSNAERFLRVLDALQLPSCDLVATSYGGAEAMVAASLAPGRFSRLVLVAPVNPWSAHGRRIAPFLSNPLIAPLFLRLYPFLQAAQGHFIRRVFGGEHSIPPDSIAGYSAILRRPGVLQHALQILRTWNADIRYLEKILPNIRHIPVLLIWGKQDGAVYLSSAPKLRENFQRSELVTFDGVGHLPYEEAPNEFAKAMLKFLCGK
jgi:pimeloyl-ACP methyl ester carboxylesterase